MSAINLPSYETSYGSPFLTDAFALGGRGRALWVGNASGLPASNGDDPDHPLSTIEGAWAKTKAGRGDIIYVLPGHTQTLTSATSFGSAVASTKIIGLGTGLERPTFTLGAAGAVITITKANVMIRNCRFLAAGPAGTTALTVANAFAISGAGFQFIGNEVELGVDADQLCTDCFSLSAAATDATFAANYMRGNAASVITTVLKTTGAVDRLKLIENVVSAEVATAATGVLFDLSNAAIADNLIFGNYLANNTASSKFVIKPHATSTGFVDYNRYFTGDGATTPATSGWSTYTTTYKFGGDNKAVTAVSVSALLSPAVDA